MIEDICMIILCISMFYMGHIIFKRFILPKLIDIGTKELEKNPKWLIPQLRKTYYGFHDIDIIVAESTNPFSILPRFRLTKNDRYELWIPDDITTKDVDIVAQLALMGKINVKYGLFYENKSTYWLSILCFMLDGGDVTQAAKLEKKEN